MMIQLVVLILLHGPDGHPVGINIDEITAIHCKGSPNNPSHLFTDGVNTVINLSDGKFASVSETCEEIRKQLKEKNK